MQVAAHRSTSGRRECQLFAWKEPRVPIACPQEVAGRVAAYERQWPIDCLVERERPA